MKKWLNENKVIFDTIAAFSLTFMSIIVSFNMYRLSAKQLKYETEKHQPTIKIVTEEIGDDWELGAADVLNVGEKAIFDGVETVEFFNLMCEKYDPEITVKLRVPIFKYLSGSIVYDNRSGLWVKFLPTSGSKYFGYWTEIISRQVFDKIGHSCEYFEGDVEIIASIQYIDSFNEVREKYFEVEDGYTELPQNVGKGKFIEYRSLSREREALDYEDMSLEVMTTLINELLRK